MNERSKAHKKILEEQIGETGVRALVVEGDDDRDFFEAILNKVAPGVWENGWVVGSAGGKAKVQTILALEPDWIGVVDRDEWSQQAIECAMAELDGRLHVLPRYCVESYFVDSDELWDALPLPRKAEITGGIEAFKNTFTVGMEPWIRHGALWHAVQPLWSRLNERGFTKALLDETSALSDDMIKAKLQEWHALLEPEDVFQQFENFYSEASAATLREQLRVWVHGKHYFKSHVTPKLNSLLTQKSAEFWLVELRKDLPAPSDLNPIWHAMGIPTPS